MKHTDKKEQEQLYFQYNQRLDNLLKIVLDQVRDCKIPASRNINPHIFINTRAKKRYGACQQTKRNGKKEYTIEISSRLYNLDDKIIQGVIAHEILHTCKGAMNHGEKWKNYARIMNEKYGYNIKRVSTLEEMGLKDQENKNENNNDNCNFPAEAKYMIKCRQCGSVIYRMRQSNVTKNPQKYRCKCGGQLDVFVIKNKEKI